MWPERDDAWKPGRSDICDDERDRVMALLRLHCTEGRISLDEIEPDGIHVELEGIAVFGERRFDVRGSAPVPVSPTVVIKAYACFGEVRVRSPRVQRRALT